MVNTTNLKLLLVEDNLTDANWISKTLDEYKNQKFHIKHVQTIKDGISSLSQDNFDAIILDLSLPDSQGITSLDTLQRKAPQLPIVIVTNNADPKITVQSLRQGAQDYLIKGEFTRNTLVRSIQYAIERQRIEFNERQQALMKKMLDTIRNSINLEVILKNTVREIQKFLNTEQVLIYRCESDLAEEMAVVSSSLNTKSGQLNAREFTSSINVSSLKSIISQSTSVRAVEDTGMDFLADDHSQNSNSVKSYLILPIWFDESIDRAYEDLTHPIIQENEIHKSLDGLWGMLIAYNTNKSRSWEDWEINFLQKFTTQVTIAIQQSQICCRLHSANQKLQQLAILDGLTGIANRRYFDLVLHNEWQRLTREQKPLSLILCDVDHFKAYNDAYGHQKGDICLQKIATILKKSTRRPADLAARYGGEEFAIILPNTDAKGALFIANQINQKLAKKRLSHEKSRVSQYVTCSMGICTLIPNSQQSIKDLIEKADCSLYRAKEAGRNQIAIHGQEQDSYRELKALS